MFRKRNLLLSLIMLLAMASVLPAAATTYTWDNQALDGDWNNPTNWSSNIVPPNTSSYYAAITMAAGPIVSTGDTVNVYRIVFNGAAGIMTVNDGTVNVSNHIYVADILTAVGTLNVNGGSVNITGTLYIARDGGSIGTVNVLGGAVTCGVLNMAANGGTARINIEEGTLTFTSSAVAVTTYIANGWIRAYNGVGTLNVDTTTIPGKTILSALPQTAAVNPSPANNAQGVTTTPVLSWHAVPSATSHDVYFGTSQADVAGAHRLLADLNGNTVVDWPDVSIMTQSWLLDPAGTDPYAGMDDTNDVNFYDYSLLAQDWMNKAPTVFKGNQDANTFEPGLLSESMIYYWRVDEVNGPDTTTGGVWQFATQGFANVRKGPYLIFPGNNTQMTVLWQLDATTSASNIAWGTDTTYSTGNANTTEYGTDHQHKYTITGLTPGTKYYYRVTISGVAKTGSFTAAPAADATNVKFFMYGDTRTNAGSHNSVAARMNAIYAADPNYQTIVLHAGDWVNASTEADWTGQWYTAGTNLDIWTLAAKLPIMGCIGNHETGSMPVFQKYRPFPFAIPSRAYYSFDYGPLHVLVADQYTTYTAGSDQHNWMISDLSSSNKPFKILIFHQPAWNSGGSHGNDATAQAVFQPLAVEHGAQICLAGHNHFYSRAVNNGVHHITSGAGGAPFYSASAGQPYVVTYRTDTLECVKVDIAGNTLTYTTVSNGGAVIDGPVTITLP